MNNRKIFIQLGRYGDILNILPLARAHFKLTGEKPLVQIAKAFAGIMDGVSYAEPLIFGGDFKDAQRAIFQARLISTNISLCQIYGSGLRHKEDCWSFARQSWQAGQAGIPWGTLPLLIDRRDALREKELRGQLGLDAAAQAGKKIVLLVTGGISSPFARGRWLAANLPQLLGEEYFVCDISVVPCERLYDLLGLMDVAHCLVTTDTAPLHLAHASDVPVVALINNQPKTWHGSPWRPNQVARFYYEEFPGCITDVLLAIGQAREAGPTILHAYADFRDAPMDEETYRRHDLARRSWRMEYEVTHCWAPVETVKNDARRDGRAIGDSALPFVRDVIDAAVARARKGSDIIALTNADVGLTPGVTGKILEACRRHGAAFTHRWDFYRLTKPLISEQEISYGAWYPGSDAFFFTVNWWRDHGGELGDYVMGREHWDQALRFLIKYHDGVGIERGIYHEKHASAWEQPDLRDVLPGNLHNRALFQKYADALGVRGSDWIWWKCCDVDAVYRHG